MRARRNRGCDPRGPSQFSERRDQPPPEDPFYHRRLSPDTGKRAPQIMGDFSDSPAVQMVTNWRTSVSQLPFRHRMANADELG